MKCKKYGKQLNGNVPGAHHHLDRQVLHFHSGGNSICPQGPHQVRVPGIPSGKHGGKYHTVLFRPLVGTLHNNLDAAKTWRSKLNQITVYFQVLILVDKGFLKNSLNWKTRAIFREKLWVSQKNWWEKQGHIKKVNKIKIKNVCLTLIFLSLKYFCKN